jgi:hypothetical protein
MKKYPKGLDEAKYKHVDESIKSELLNSFPFGSKHVERFLWIDSCLLLGEVCTTH